jgi:hypothetical protein
MEQFAVWNARRHFEKQTAQSAVGLDRGLKPNETNRSPVF